MGEAVKIIYKWGWVLPIYSLLIMFKAVGLIDLGWFGTITSLVWGPILIVCCALLCVLIIVVFVYIVIAIVAGTIWVFERFKS